jgi:hypothetical protein
MSQTTDIIGKVISVVYVSSVLLIATAAPCLAQRGESTVSAKPRVAEPNIEIKEDALKNVIRQFQVQKPAEWSVKPESIRQFYGQGFAATTLSKSKAIEHVQLATTLEKSALQTKSPAEWLSVSEQAYRSTIKRTEGITQLWVSSNYCAQLLRHEKFDEAVSVMRNVRSNLNDASLDRIAKSRALYNYGKALQMTDQHQEAYDVLRESMEADPTFSKAAVAAGESALKAPHEWMGIPQVLELTNKQMSQFAYAGAAETLRDALLMRHWQENNLYPQLMRQLVLYFTVTQASPETFKKEWSRFLQRLFRNLPFDHPCREMVNHIRMIFYDSSNRLTIMDMDPPQIQRFYNVWLKTFDRSGDNSGIAFLSEFIKIVGDHYYRQRDPDSLSRCMILYSHAWGLDAHNIDAGIYLADTLFYVRKNKDLKLDPDGEILRGFIFRLFAIKGEEYQREFGTDWDKIMKCHVILARIFEELKQWWGSDSNAETARFQWNAAKRALEMPGISPEDREWFRPTIIKGIEEAKKHRN